MSKTWDDIIKPVITLSVICLVVSAALAFTNSVTAPVIAANAAKAADAARIELLPAADAFTKVEYTGDGVVEVYKANNGTGYVITGSSKGYGGDVQVMVAFNKDSKIENVKVLDNSETPGLGKKIEEPSFYTQYNGKEAKELVLGTDLAAITGATISSNAATDAVNYAVVAYNAVAKGVVQKELTPEELAASILPEGSTVTLSDKTADGVSAIYESDAGMVLVAEAPGYEGEPVVAYVAVGADGTIIGLHVDASTQTKGLGTKVAKEDYTSQFIGQTDAAGVEVIAGATFSSDALCQAVDQAMAAYNTVKGA